MRYRLYRWFMTLAHRHGWHKMEESHPEGDVMLWCHWCGLRIVTKIGPPPELCKHGYRYMCPHGCQDVYFGASLK